jgi:hypothetical protein
MSYGCGLSKFTRGIHHVIPYGQKGPVATLRAEARSGSAGVYHSVGGRCDYRVVISS